MRRVISGRGYVVWLLAMLTIAFAHSCSSFSRGQPEGPAMVASDSREAVVLPDFVFLSMIDRAPGGLPARSTSRLATAGEYLQFSTELNNGVLLDLQVLKLDVPYVLALGQAIDVSPSQAASGRPPDEPTDEPLSDLMPALAFLARAEGGLLATFESIPRDAAGHDYQDFVDGFDRAMRLPQVRRAPSGIYLRALPYSAQSEPDLTFTELPKQLDGVFSRPGRFHPVTRDALIQDLGRGAGEPGFTAVVRVGSSTFAVAVFELP